MPRQDVTPLAELDRRLPMAGRIRLGVKDKGAPKSIDTFRFTSPFEDVIRQIAAQYGGDAKPWNDPKANPPAQWQVITNAKEVSVYIVRHGLSCWYEQWVGGGCLRRCDGEICEINETSGDDVDKIQVPCICDKEKSMACQPHTRLTVLLPDVAFRGAWLLQTKGYNAAFELPGMVEMIDHMSAQGHVVAAVLSVERRTQQTPGRRKRSFVVPRISILNTPGQLVSGDLGLPTPVAISAPEPALALEETNEIIEAEVVEEPSIYELLRADARNFGLDPARFLRAVRTYAADDLVRMTKASNMMRAEQLIPIGFNPDGTVQWRKQ
jgi:hypothetical protein